jgi:hypothetical protein
VFSASVVFGLDVFSFKLFSIKAPVKWRSEVFVIGKNVVFAYTTVAFIFFIESWRERSWC